MRVAPGRGKPVQRQLVEVRTFVGRADADGQVRAQFPVREGREFVAIEQEALMVGEGTEEVGAIDQARDGGAAARPEGDGRDLVVLVAQAGREHPAGVLLPIVRVARGRDGGGLTGEASLRQVRRADQFQHQVRGESPSGFDQRVGGVAGAVDAPAVIVGAGERDGRARTSGALALGVVGQPSEARGGPAVRAAFDLPGASRGIRQRVREPEVDHAAERVGTVERGRRTAQDLDRA